MCNIPYEIQGDIAPEDAAILIARREVIQAALLFEPIRWEVKLDSRSRPHYLGLRFSTTADVLIQLAIEDIRLLDDDRLRGRIIAGEFGPRTIN